MPARGQPAILRPDTTKGSASEDPEPFASLAALSVETDALERQSGADCPGSCHTLQVVEGLPEFPPVEY